ncbi:MAG: bifunctional folylpolyglutamate synthase/dihydrofolate synthase [Bellilinea sp.]
MENVEAAYQSTLDYLYSFVDYSLTRSLRYSPEKFDLGRMAALAAALGSPHRQYPVVHVAGTKGKGSTSAMIASVLQTAGYKVGLYTSPHLVDYTERIQVNRQPVSHEQLVELVERLKPEVAKIEQLTTFELTTAAAFLCFAEEKVDIAVIEVGLGGRLDATNIVDPRVSVITSLSMDHMNVLGDTLEKIAAEKGGIIKPGRPVVVAHQKTEAAEVLKKIAKERHSPIIFTDDAYFASLKQHSLAGQEFTIRPAAKTNGNNRASSFNLPLLGAHQVQNALTAYAALKVLHMAGIKISSASIYQGFASVSWPGRFEILQNDPLVVIDSAHNLDSAEKLAQTIRDYLPGQSVGLVFGASEDKDVTGMLGALFPVIESIMVTQSVHPRSYDAVQLGEAAQKFGLPVAVNPQLESALEQAYANLKPDGALVITGSIFIAAGARQYWFEKKTSLKLA